MIGSPGDTDSLHSLPSYDKFMAHQDLYPPTISYENEKQNDKLPTYSEYIGNPEKYHSNSIDGNSKVLKQI